MRDSFNPLTGERQSFYFPDDHPQYPGWFKGMEHIIRERGLWPEGNLPADCHSKDPKEQINCCCHHILYSQPNFTSQKSLLEKVIESCGHFVTFIPDTIAS